MAYCFSFRTDEDVEFSSSTLPTCMTVISFSQLVAAIFTHTTFRTASKNGEDSFRVT